MTTLFARPPLQELPMSKVQSGARRQSSRLQQREDSVPPTNSIAPKSSTNPVQPAKPETKTATNNSKKRKAQYDEEDDGFKFSRVKKRKATPPLSAVTEHVPEETALSKPAAGNTQLNARNQQPAKNGEAQSPKRPTKKRMSFSTPTKKDHQPVRRSKRLSSEVDPRESSPHSPKALQKLKPVKVRKEKNAKHRPPAEDGLQSASDNAVTSQQTSNQPEDESHAPTKIALPFADTPVISRNKAMRQDRASKGERRSSLGLRGRRASSLIESGTSNGKFVHIS